MALSTSLLVVGAFILAAAAQAGSNATWIQPLVAHPLLARIGALTAWIAGIAVSIALHGWSVGLTLAVVTVMAALASAALVLPFLAPRASTRRMGAQG